MSHFRHPRLLDPPHFNPGSASRVAINHARDYYIHQLRHRLPVSARANPYAPGHSLHDVWVAALLTEAGDTLDIAASFGGDYTCHG